MEGIPSSGGLPPSVPMRPLWPDPPARMGRTRGAQRLVTIAFGGLAVLLVLGLGYAGMAPWSGALPGYRSATSGSSAVSYDQAVQAAAPLVAGYAAGSWSLMNAIGFEPRAAFVLPGPEAGPVGGTPPLGQPPVPACNWTAVGGSDLTHIAIPGTNGPVGGGAATGWLLGYLDPVGDQLVATVLGGQASLYAVQTQPSCYGLTADTHPIPADAIDSPTAAAIARSWGGAAFQANVTTAVAIYAVQGGYTLSMYPPPIYSNGSGTSYPNGPQPPPVPTNVSTIAFPPTWVVSYSSCPMELGGVPGGVAPPSSPTPMGNFAAVIDAVNGTVSSASAYLGSGSGSMMIGPVGPPTMAGTLASTGTVTAAARTGALFGP